MSDVIEIIEHKKMDLSNCMLSVAFPTVGLISSIAGHHIVQSLKLKEIGAIVSNEFMPTTVIHDRYPSPPVRIYAGKKKCGPTEGCDQIAVIMSEFMPPLKVIGPLVDAILDWGKQKKCRIITAFEGSHGKKKEKIEEGKVYGIGSTPHMQEMLEKFDISQMEEGMITGVTGVLLYKSALEQQNAMCLLAKAQSRYPDSRAAAKLIQILDVMLPGIKLDPQPLYEEAERIEKKIKSFMEQSKPTAPQSAFPTDMYR